MGRSFKTQGYATESWVTAKSYLQNGVLASPLYRSGGDLVIIAGGPQTTRPHPFKKFSIIKFRNPWFFGWIWWHLFEFPWCVKFRRNTTV